MRRVIALLAAAAAVSQLLPSTVTAGKGDGGTGGGGTVTPPAFAKQSGLFSGGRPDNWQSPCPNDVEVGVGETYHIAIDPLRGASTSGLSHVSLPPKLSLVTAKTVMSAGVPLYGGLSYTTCVWRFPLDEEGNPRPVPVGHPFYGSEFYVGAYWYPIQPTPGALIPAAFAAAQGLMSDPVLSWPNMNPDLGSVYVKVPMAYVLDPVSFVEATATAENELGSASATVRATPTRIEVAGPDGSSSCLVGDAMTDHGDDESPPCFLLFNRVSDGAGIGVTLTWTITSDMPGADLPAELTTSSEFTVPVGEVQALVTGRGDGG